MPIPAIAFLRCDCSAIESRPNATPIEAIASKAISNKRHVFPMYIISPITIPMLMIPMIFWDPFNSDSLLWITVFANMNKATEITNDVIV